MAADERLLAAIRRFSGTKEQVEAAYQAVFAAYSNRLAEVTVIIGKSAGEDSASGQVVVGRDDYEKWLECFEVRMRELEAEEAGEETVVEGLRHTVFGCRYART